LGIYGGLFNITPLTLNFGIILFLITLVILYLTGYYPIIRTNKTKNDQKLELYKKIEYTIIILFVISGSLFLMSSNDYISLYISLELQSYGLYIISTIYRNSEPSTGAGLTYFLLGGLSSCFILLGIGLIYANIGTTYLDNFQIFSDLSNIISNLKTKIFIYKFLGISILLIMVGLLFKISAAPFHF
jgi:NADH-ubiquinone oxidoreductase chain 2